MNFGAAAVLPFAFAHFGELYSSVAAVGAVYMRKSFHVYVRGYVQGLSCSLARTT